MEHTEQQFDTVLDFTPKDNSPRKAVMPWYSLMQNEFQDHVPNKAAA